MGDRDFMYGSTAGGQYDIAVAGLGWFGRFSSVIDIIPNSRFILLG